MPKIRLVYCNMNIIPFGTVASHIFHDTNSKDITFLHIAAPSGLTTQVVRYAMNRQTHNHGNVDNTYT